MNLADFVHENIVGLIEKTNAAALLAEENSSDDAVHDLRVAIRRLSEALRVFEDVLPRGAAKAIRKDLREAMRIAGKARNHDIAAGLMKLAGIEVGPEINAGRTKADRQLAMTLESWNKHHVAKGWKKQILCLT